MTELMKYVYTLLTFTLGLCVMAKGEMHNITTAVCSFLLCYLSEIKL